MKFNKLIPELNVYDIKKSLNFYSKILGFRIEYERKEDKFVFVSLEGSQIMLQETKKNDKWDTGKLEYPFGRGINFQIEVKDVERIYRRIKKHKWPVKLKIKDSLYRKSKVLLGNREFLIMDPDGYLLRFFQNLGEK